MFKKEFFRRKKMKIKVLAVLGLATFIGLAGCRSTANTNTTVVTNTNTMNTNMTMATPMMATADPATKATVEAALRKAGFNEVTVDATTAGVTLRGSIAKDKLSEAIRVAQEAGKKTVKNEMSVK
jgi:osmotically-inducible protein OsmY